MPQMRGKSLREGCAPLCPAQVPLRRGSGIWGGGSPQLGHRPTLPCRVFHKPNARPSSSNEIPPRLTGVGRDPTRNASRSAHCHQPFMHLTACTSDRQIAPLPPTTPLAGRRERESNKTPRSPTEFGNRGGLTPIAGNCNQSC